jgi:hypothetical protein
MLSVLGVVVPLYRNLKTDEFEHAGIKAGFCSNSTTCSLFIGSSVR